MADIEQLITTAMDTQNTRVAHGAGSGGSADHAGAIIGHLGIWSSAIKTKAGVGRGSSKKKELYGIKKLRGLILELAVRGLLVPQDINDEPASELLKRITTEKQQLIKDKKIKKQKTLPPISDEEKPFELPNGWEWVQLGQITNANTGFAFKSTEYTTAGTFVLRVTNINPDGTINKSDRKFISQEAAADKYSKFSLSENDLLLVMVGGSLGKLGIVSEDILPAVLNQNMWKFDCHGDMPVDFLYQGISYINRNHLEVTKSTHGHLSQGQYLAKPLPLPPLAEQHRIVAKVDELMALCDQLEQQTETSLTAHQTLVETVLAALTRPTAPSAGSEKSTALQATDSSAKPATLSPEAILFEHFDTLFTTQHSIDQLKQTILQLAVMGKLVPQNTNDEPASELLKKIAAEKAQLIKDKKIKKQKPLPPISDEEKPFDLPEGWEWSRLGNIYSFLNGYAFKSEWFTEGGIKLLRNINIGHGETRWNDIANIPLHMEEEFERFKLFAGDVVISLDRPIINTGLKYTVIKEDDLPCFLLQRVAKFHSIGDFIQTSFLGRWLESSVFIESVDPGRSNGVPHISTKQLEAGVFPVLSENEQRRIVAKVDELMALCDQLKAHLNNAQTTQLHLADVLAEQAIS